MDDITDYTPGSPEAQNAGCTCDPGVNNYGEGLPGEEGRLQFFTRDDCPLHGLAQAIRDMGVDDEDDVQTLLDQLRRSAELGPWH